VTLFTQPYSYIMDHKVPERVPVVRVDIAIPPHQQDYSMMPYSLELVCKNKWQAYIYFMLLLKLGWIVSGYHRKIYITKAQLRLAKTGQALAVIFSRELGESREVDLRDETDDGYGNDGSGDGPCTASLARARMTRANT
jgi:hypothetical protein